MKLIHSGYQLELHLHENQITVLTIENKDAYRTLISDLWNQIEGGEGEILLSDGEKIKKISKEMELIFNPFGLDCNNRKVISKLHQELKGVSDEVLMQECAEVNRNIIEYLEKVVCLVPYAVDFAVDLDVNALLKMYDVRISCLGENLLEKIVEYLRTMNRICNVRVVAFVGLKQYLTADELEQLYEFVIYEKIYLICIESIYTKRIKGENSWILDKDLCIIEIGELTPLSQSGRLGENFEV